MSNKQSLQVISNSLKSTALLMMISAVIGGVAVWGFVSQTSENSANTNQSLSKLCNLAIASSKSLEMDDKNTANRNTSGQIAQQNALCSEQSLTITGGDIEPLIARLLANRSILAKDLSIMNHWTSMEDFINTFEQFELSDSERHHLLAKAQVFFANNYLAAIEELYSAQQSALNDETLVQLQGEINALLDFIRRQYFSENEVVSIRLFTRLMNLAHEKQPNYLPVIIALVRHYLLVGDYVLASNFIARIPQNTDNLLTIELLNKRLEKNILLNTFGEQGIALTKKENHYIVPVTFNNKVTLNLLLDTGASRTVVSPSTMRSLLLISDQFTDLKIRGIAQTANGPAMTQLFQANSMKVGEYSFENPIILTSRIRKNQHFDGLLGMDFLSQFKFRIDHQLNRLYLSY